MMTVGKCTGMRRTLSVSARANAPAGKAAVSRRRDARGTVRANAPRLGACGRDDGRRRATVCNASRAKLNLPEPRKVPKVEQAKFGFTEYAERINSRYAMIGFFALLAVEGIFNISILQLIGLDIGKGIDLPL